MDRGAWWATVHVIAKSRIRLSDQHTHTGFFQFLLGPWLSPVILEWRMAGYLVVKRIDSLQIKKKKKKKTILGEN